MYRIKQDKRSEQSCRLIVEALSQVMQEKPFEHITVQELMKTAQMGRATFYRYFDAISDVLQMKTDEVFAELYRFLLDEYRRQELTQELPQAPFLRPFLRFWYLHAGIIELLIRANRLDILSGALAAMMRKYVEHLPKMGPFANDRFDYFAAVRSGVALNVLVQWVRNGLDLPPDDLTDLLIRQLRQAIEIKLL